jgi:hypothetical protein
MPRLGRLALVGDPTCTSAGRVFLFRAEYLTNRAQSPIVTSLGGPNAKESESRTARTRTTRSYERTHSDQEVTVRIVSMSPEMRREISIRGGKAAHAKGIAHKFTLEKAREARRKGGQVAQARKAAAKKGIETKG